MSQLPTTSISPDATAEFLPPPYEQPHVHRQLDELIQEVAEVIAPVWPLKDYVAVNPYAGISQRSFMGGRAFLKLFSDCETLMPLEFYAEQHQQGRLSAAAIEAAIAELGLSAGDQEERLSARWIVERLKAVGENDDHSADHDGDPMTAPANDTRVVRTLSEYADAYGDIDWTDAIRDEVSKHCAAHYDEGQSVWGSPWKDLSLYQAWRSAAVIDRNIEILGLVGFRRFVSELPHSPRAAIVWLLQRLGVPAQLWQTFLLCQAFSIPGWSAWAKYQSSWNDDASVDHDDLAGLLAMRLAYDVAVGETLSISVNWDSIGIKESASFDARERAVDDAAVRHVLLRAMEIAYRDELLGGIAVSSQDQSCPQRDGKSASHESEQTDRKLAQMVFCIDVRSERMRRNLESRSAEIETFGFAGFFGMPVEFVTLGQTRGNRHVPVLLKPQFQLHEGLQESDSVCEATAIGDRKRIRTWRRLWKGFQTSGVGCFSFVETTGLLYGWKLLAKALGWQAIGKDAGQDGVATGDGDKLGPTLRGLNHQGITTSHQADLAESTLRNLGLTRNFARLVVFCGHASQTDNNPLAAGLDCGACGGHSGEPNARMAALLLNQPYIRAALAQRGIEIPEDTHFLGGLHNTTTDRIELFDRGEVPETHRDDVEQLLVHTANASELTRRERMPTVTCDTVADLMRRAVDWSEVRPEWGLAGNAAFIVGPRSLTKQADLQGRSFLHSYDFDADPDGSVLETIMTAPMIVAHWINMQYYASVVDNHHFGSGNKTVHNVVGRFGILSGNSGDLMTGLPWQSLHTGDDFQHFPMRLQVLIEAPRPSIDSIIAKHDVVGNLLTGGWLHLVAIDDGCSYRYAEDGSWQAIDAEQSAARVPAPPASLV